MTMPATASAAGLREWMMAVRPQTLPAGAAPVVVGIGVAYYESVFATGPALAALIGALLIQIGTNFANDYYDAQRGVDGPDREGFTRVTQAGIIPEETVKRAMILTFGCAFGIGTFLVYIGGIPIVIIGIASVLCGIAYAGGPAPFGSYGLGDVFVFVFFGVVAVTGTYYVQAVTVVADSFPLWIPAGSIASSAVIASLAMAGLTTAILVVNNIRDIETDRAAGKYTLAVLIGRRYSVVEFVLLLGLAYSIPVYLLLLEGAWILGLPLLTIPYGVLLCRDVITGPGGSALNQTLESTGRLLAIFAILFTIGFLLA